MKAYEVVEAQIHAFLALDGNGQLLENLGIFQETVSIKLNIPDNIYE
jgi:hypothetical protein